MARSPVVIIDVAVSRRMNETLDYSGMQANQTHPSPQTLDPVLAQMYWTQLNKAIESS